VDGKRIESSNNFEELITQAEKSSGFVWIGMAEPTESEFNEISERFALHPLAIEDAVNALQRPKLEEYEGLHFLVAKTVFFKEIENDITTGELMFFVGKNFIVIVRHGEGSPLQM
jgi:magnesium transporter